MSDLKDFVESRDKDGTFGPPLQKDLSVVINTSLIGLDLGVTSSELNKFSDEVAKIAYSDEVLSELSDSIGEPKESETEDEFVERAKLALSEIINKKLRR